MRECPTRCCGAACRNPLHRAQPPASRDPTKAISGRQWWTSPVIHTIHDAEGWQKALDDPHEYPSGFELRSFVQAADGTRALCLWDAPSEAGLQAELDR